MRRLLSRENIYTLKLIRRGHPVPRGLHANMFLVQSAKDVMETDVPIVPAELSLDEFLLREENRGAIRHVVVTRGNRISGVLRINTGIRQQLARTQTGVTLGDVARTDFVLVRPADTMFDVIGRVARRGVQLAIVVAPARVPRVEHVLGVIGLETMGEAVIDNARVYAPAPAPTSTAPGRPASTTR